MKDLYRLSSPIFRNPKKLIIIGNGAVKDGWEPLVSAVRSSNRFASLSSLAVSNLKCTE